MSMTNAAEQAFLDLLFLNVDWANIGDASGLQNSATAGSFYVSLHSSDPGEAGSQTTNEVAYTSYARVAVARTSGGWTRTTSTMANTALVQFPQCTGSTATAQRDALAVEIAESVIDKAKEQAKATDKRNRAALLAWMLLR